MWLTHCTGGEMPNTYYEFENIENQIAENAENPYLIRFSHPVIDEFNQLIDFAMTNEN